eukprot:3655424-Pyramimonas_sp.AAC.1
MLAGAGAHNGMPELRSLSIGEVHVRIRGARAASCLRPPPPVGSSPSPRDWQGTPSRPGGRRRAACAQRPSPAPAAIYGPKRCFRASASKYIIHGGLTGEWTSLSWWSSNVTIVAAGSPGDLSRSTWGDPQTTRRARTGYISVTEGASARNKCQTFARVSRGDAWEGSRLIATSAATC